jgi:aspartyl-tRNA(Asn)/glutamyl-tRNA(Gln) amidotransferase subunit A
MLRLPHPAVLADLPFLSLAELARRLGAGATTSVAITQACLANIDAQDARLHAFVEVWRDDALRLARAADLEREAGFVRGRLHGLPIAIKDLFHVAGRQTTAGSRSWLGSVSTATAHCVQRLLDAGMIPLGKTHMVELAYGTWGTNAPMGAPWNPWDLGVHRVAGGSSSGSAVAVAAGMAPAALGTDTGGSVRIPASLCALVGLKPTYGRIPLEGVVPLSRSLDSVGPLARSVEDAMLLVAAMAGESEPAPQPPTSLAGKRITALAGTQFPDFIEPDVAAAFAASVARLRELGAQVTQETIPFDFAELGTRNGRLIGIEGYAAHRELVDDDRADMDPGVRMRMRLGKSASAAEYLAALEARASAMAGFAHWMQGRDALVTPMLPITARPVGAVDEATYPLATWSRAVNYLGACALSVPAQLSSDGLPIGIQFVGSGGAESALCRLAIAAMPGEGHWLLGAARRPPGP